MLTFNPSHGCSNEYKKCLLLCEVQMSKNMSKTDKVELEET